MYASLLFHLFSEEKQLHLLRALAGLLSPEPGSMIFGLHIGLAEASCRIREEVGPCFAILRKAGRRCGTA